MRPLPPPIRGYTTAIVTAALSTGGAAPAAAAPQPENSGPGATTARTPQGTGRVAQGLQQQEPVILKMNFTCRQNLNMEPYVGICIATK